MERPHVGCLPGWLKHTLKYESLEAFQRLCLTYRSHISLPGEAAAGTNCSGTQCEWQAARSPLFHVEHSLCTMTASAVSASAQAEPTRTSYSSAGSSELPLNSYQERVRTPSIAFASLPEVFLPRKSFQVIMTSASTVTFLYVGLRIPVLVFNRLQSKFWLCHCGHGLVTSSF